MRGTVEKWMFCDSGFNSRQRKARVEILSSLKFDSTRLRGISETEILETWSGAIVANKQSKKRGYKVTSTRSFQKCGNNWGGDYEVELWELVWRLWGTLDSYQKLLLWRRDHHHHKIMAIITRSWQSSGHLVWDDHLCYLPLGSRRKTWYAHKFIFLRRKRIWFTISVFLRRRISHTIYLHIFLRRRRIWYIIYRNIYFSGRGGAFD